MTYIKLTHQIKSNAVIVVLNAVESDLAISCFRKRSFLVKVRKRMETSGGYFTVLVKCETPAKGFNTLRILRYAEDNR